MNRDHYLFGVFLGILIPILGILFFYVLLYIPDGLQLSSFLYLLKTNSRALSKMISMGLLACIPLFTYYRNRKLYKTLYGIFIPVILFALLAIGSRLDIF